MSDSEINSEINYFDDFIEIEYLNNEMDDIDSNCVDSNPTPKKMKKMIKSDIMQRDDKRKMCGIIKNHPCIYDLTDKHHKNSHAVTAAWKGVSKEMGFSG